MICKNDLDTTYIAHQEQTYTIPCQQPMRSIGTVRDEFIKVNGEWKERHNIASIILNGTEDWDKRFGDSLYNLTGFLNEKPFIVGYGKSNYYKYNSVQSGINTNTAKRWKYL